MGRASRARVALPIRRTEPGPEGPGSKAVPRGEAPARWHHQCAYLPSTIGSTPPTRAARALRAPARALRFASCPARAYGSRHTVRESSSWHYQRRPRHQPGGKRTATSITRHRTARLRHRHQHQRLERDAGDGKHGTARLRHRPDPQARLRHRPGLDPARLRHRHRHQHQRQERDAGDGKHGTARLRHRPGTSGRSATPATASTGRLGCAIAPAPAAGARRQRRQARDGSAAPSP